MSYHIHLVEEHKNLSDLFTHYLRNEGWDVSVNDNEREATRKPGGSIHVWVMDILFSGADGQQLVKEIKEHSPHVPVIVISDHDRILEQISNLKLKEVYCLAKPFMPRDLVGLIHELLGDHSTNLYA